MLINSNICCYLVYNKINTYFAFRNFKEYNLLDVNVCPSPFPIFVNFYTYCLNLVSLKKNMRFGINYIFNLGYLGNRRITFALIPHSGLKGLLP